MKKSVIKMQPNSILLDAKAVKAVFGHCPSTFRSRKKEIAEWVKKGRYSEYAFAGDKVNLFVYYDYDTHRQQLKDKNASKYTEEFNPMEIEKIFPIVERVVVIPESEI